jgi:hypothetical protein
MAVNSCLCNKTDFSFLRHNPYSSGTGHIWCTPNLKILPWVPPQKKLTRMSALQNLRIPLFRHTINSRMIAMSLHMLESVLVPFSGGKFENKK